MNDPASKDREVLGTATSADLTARSPQRTCRLGFTLEDLTWLEAERLLIIDTLVVIPLGAAAKEHGPHLRLNNDWVIADYFKQRVLEQAAVVMAPTLSYNYYPAFVEYPGSISLRLETARDLVVDICASLAAFGPRRFYVLNTGVSTARPLAQACEQLGERGILLAYTDLHSAGRAAVVDLQEQDGGTHADEMETSLMLYIAPERVDMERAVRDFHRGEGRLTRTRSSEGTYSPSGVYGDATLARWRKGRALAQALLASMLEDIARLKEQPLPTIGPV